MIFEEIQYYEITDYENYYVSRCGKILSTKYKKPRVLKPGTNRYGYHHVVFFSNGKGKNMSVHRLVAMSFLQNYTEDLQVDHKDNNKTNNNLTNLRMVTQSVNCRNVLKAVGVFKDFIKQRDAYSYNAQWVDDAGKTHRRGFAVNKYGEDVARQKATELRQEMVDKYYNRPAIS